MLACVAAASDLAELDDAAARVQYAFYSRDERGLRAALTDLEHIAVSGEHASTREYQLGVGYWHLADLTTTSAHNQALKRCEEHLDATVQLAPRHAEALAIRALCADQQNKLLTGGTRALTRGCQSQASLLKALELAPRNPRVLYAQAVCAMSDGNVGKASEVAQRAWAAFDGSPLTADDDASWGQAETCLLLARLSLRSGERAAARDRVEQALILAPDYVAAHELLTEISSGR